MNEVMELVMDYAVKADEASVAGETLQFWEYLEENCGVIGEQVDQEMFDLLGRFYETETLMGICESWSRGESFAGQ